MKKISASFFIAGILTFAGFLFAGSACAETEISGNITSDTTWTLAESPYIVTGTVQVLEGVKLTIEPGVVIKIYHGKQIMIDGEIKSIGTYNNLITFTSYDGTLNGNGWEGMYFTSKATNISISYSVFQDASNALYFNYNTVIIGNNIFRYNAGAITGRVENINVINNTFYKNSAAIFRLWSRNDSFIRDNNFIDNDYILRVCYEGNINITDNNFIGNQIFEGSLSPNNLNATNNWWGTFDASLIDSKIYDYYDNISFGKVNYEPYANVKFDFDAPILVEVAQVSTPTGDNTPDYIFSSDEAGTITYGGLCSGTTTAAIVGNNTITFNALADGIYNNCTITVTDAMGNASLPLSIAAFTIDPDMFAAQTVVDQIFALPIPANLILGDASTIAGARVNYNALTESQKNLVTNLATLITAETQISSLTVTEDKVTELELGVAKDLTMEINLTIAELAVTKAYLTFPSVTAGRAKIDLANRFNVASGTVSGAAISADKTALLDSLIQGANVDLSHITKTLTNPLPAHGIHGSSIKWTSSNTGIVSNDGQTINRPTFANGDETVALTAAISRGWVTICTLNDGEGSGNGGGGSGGSCGGGGGGTTKIFTLTVSKLPTVLDSIAIAAPATKLSYTVGDSLSIAGLAVTGTYSDNSTTTETITTANITGFNSATPATGQVLTITINGKTAAYAVNIVAAPVVTPVASGGGGGGGGGGTTITINKIAPQVMGASTTIDEGVQKPISQMTRAEKLAKIAEIRLLIIQLIQQLIIELQKQLLAANH